MFDEKVQRFLSWAKENNLVISPNISVNNFEHFGLGGHMDHPVNDDQIPFTLIRIPLKAAINAPAALASEFGQQFIKFTRKQKFPSDSQHTNNDLFEKKNILFYLFLIHERFVKEQTSFWFPYLELLPDHFDTSIFFTQQELDALKGTNLLSMLTL
jgi:hypothetical protein